MTTAARPQRPAWTKPVIGLGPARKIIGFWHIGVIGDWSRIVVEQYDKLRDSGVYDACEQIVVGFIGGKGRERELTVPILGDAKFELFATASIDDYEFPTLARVWQHAQDHAHDGAHKEARAPFLCFYMHTKGASLADTHLQQAVNAWRRYMEYFNLERWRDCVEVLTEHDTCGVELQSEDSHYSGNFWWATSEYIRRLPDAYQYWEQHRNDRVAAEFYLCLGRPKAYCFHDFVENLYDYELPPEAYRR